MRRLLLGLLALFVLLGVLLFAALHSETVFREALGIARPLIPGNLDYQDVSGTLSGPVRIRNAEYEIAGTRVRAADLQFDPSPFALLGRRVSLGDVRATGLEIYLAAGEAEDDGGPPPSPREILETLRLPVEIHADSLAVRDAKLARADETLLALEELELKLAWTNERIVIRELDAKGPQLATHGTVSLGLAEGNASEVSLEARWEGFEFPLAASVHGSGDARNLRLEGVVSAPGEVTFNILFENLLDEPSWTGRIGIDQVRPATFGEGLPEQAWAGDIEFQGRWKDTQFRMRARGDWPPLEGVDARLEGRVNARRLDVAKLDAAVGSFDTRIHLSGRLDYGDGLLYSATGRVDRFTWPGQEPFALRDAHVDVAGDAERIDGSVRAKAGLRDDASLAVHANFIFDTQYFEARANGERLQFDINGPLVSLAGIEAQASGRPEDYRLAALATGRYAEWPAARIEATATGNLETMNVDVARLEWLEGAARGNVALDWRDALRLQARIAGNGFQLQRLDAAIAATVGGRVALNADFAGAHPDLDVSIESLTGELAGTRLEGRGRVRLANNRLSTPGLAITAGDASLHLRDAPDAGFEFELDIPALAALYPPLAGSVRANGHFGGRLETPDLRLSAAGRDIEWQGYALNAFELRSDVRAGFERDSAVDLDVRNVRAPGFAANRVDAALRGRMSAHELRLALDTGSGEMTDAPTGELRAAITGGWSDDRWRGSVSRLDLLHAELGEWRLTDAPRHEPIVVASGTLLMPEHCLQSPAGSACAGPLRRDGEQWRAAASIDSLPIALFSMWLPAGLDYRGELNGELDLGGDADGLHGAAELRLGAGSIRQSAAEDASELMGWTEGAAQVNLAGREARADMNMSLRDGGGITGGGTLMVPETGPMTVNANLRAHTDNLSLVPSLLPELSRLRGRFEANLNVQGPLDEPRILGEAHLRDGSARVLALGTDWRNVNIAITGEGRRISMTGHAESGDGHVDIRLNGRDTGTGFSGDAEISGKDFRALHTPEAEVDISPELRVRLDGRDLYVGGDVRVPYARIKPRDLSTATQPSADQVIVNAEERAREEGLAVHTRVTTILGEDVRVEAFRLNARLGGELTVMQEPGGPTTGTGRLAAAEGQYRAYGQDLNLERGYVIYTGQPIGNPGLDVRATRTPTPDITVGVTVRGPLAQPRVTVFSEPEMSETEALSYLLFGRSLTETTGAEASEVNSAALALGLGGQRLLGRVGEKLGVEEVRVEQIGDPDEASLVLGKYLSPDLYVSYGIGLYDAVNTFRIRYRLSSKWTVEATSGLKSSADFLYTIER